MNTSTLFILMSLATVVGCSGVGASVGAGTDPPVDEGGAPPSAGADGAAPDAATTTTDGATTTDAAVDDRVDPIALGRSWTYDVTIAGTYALCKAGSNTGTVLGQKVVSGKPSFQVQSFCPGAGTSSYAVDGDSDKVEIYYGKAWVLSLDAPVANGHTWTDGLVTYVWEKVGSVSVPAGTYGDCWKAKAQIGTSYTTFCRGVGPVRWHYRDTTGNGYDATFTASTSKVLP